MSTYKSPGVYVKEIPVFPPSVAEVETAIPAFIGYTEKTTYLGQTLINKPMQIKSRLDYENIFGKSSRNSDDSFITIEFNIDDQVESVKLDPRYYLYDSIRLFYANGGGPCYIVSVGKYKNNGAVDKDELENGIKSLRKEDEPTIIVVPDSVLTGDDFVTASIHTTMLSQCGKLGDRFAILDVRQGDKELDHPYFPVSNFRNSGTTSDLKYCAAYYPWLNTTLSIDYGFSNLKFLKPNPAGNALVSTELSLHVKGNTTLIDQLINALTDIGKIEEKFKSLKLQIRNDFETIDLEDLDPAINFQNIMIKGNELILLINSFTRWHLPAPASSFEDTPTPGIDNVTKTISEIYIRETKGELVGGNYVGNLRIQSLLKKLKTFVITAGDITTAANAADAFRYHEDYNNDGDDDVFDLDFSPLINDGIETPLNNAVLLPKFLPTPHPDPNATIKIVAVSHEFNQIFIEFMNHVHLFMDMAKARAENLETLLEQQVPEYSGIKKKINEQGLVLPPGGAMAGIYARVDNNRGVWKAPANVSINSISGPAVKLDSADQESLNVDVNSGKSVNAIRSFTGKGTLVWGARTLAGNDNEWRYISVRRFFNMAEESIKKSTSWAVFEPNDANTWVKVKGMIENYLIQKWKDGALQGEKAEHAFFVKIGLGVTMTAQDILEGRMNVEIGMAVVRPTEFIILKFSHKMAES